MTCVDRIFVSVATAIATATTVLSAAVEVPLEVTTVEPVQIVTSGAVCSADFGQAAYGNLQITLKGQVAAGKFTVRLGEKLNASGKIDRKPPGSVNFREIELVTREGQNVYKLEIPTKKPHQGPKPVKTPAAIGEVTPFRYAEIENAPATLDKSSLRQLAVHAPFDDKASAFESSDSTLNAVWDLCKHTMKATTAFGDYIDGERERLAYEGDAYINQLSHWSHYKMCRRGQVIILNFRCLVNYPPGGCMCGMQKI